MTDLTVNLKQLEELMAFQAERITTLERINTEINERWHADRQRLVDLELMATYHIANRYKIIHEEAGADPFEDA